MTTTTKLPTTMDVLTSTVVEENNELFCLLRVEERAVPTVTKPTDVLVRIEGAPINPSDLGLLLPAGCDLSRSFNTSSTSLRCPIVVQNKSLFKPRLGAALVAGNEGAGTVVAAGSDKEAQALLGRRVALLGGQMYAEYRVVAARDCLLLPPDTTAIDGAAAFVNPLTVLGMVHTFRRSAAEMAAQGIVHTAAASQLGQQLVRVCAQEGIHLVNIVRSEEQVQLLRGLGAKWVLNQTAASFRSDLVAAIEATAAFIAFDATGGGKLVSDILAAMEAAALRRNPQSFSIYGSTQKKVAFIYGSLDLSPTTLQRNYGFGWRIEGWLLMPNFIAVVSPAEVAAAKSRVARDLTTTFRTTYSKVLTLRDVVNAKEAKEYNKRATSSKVIVNPAAAHKNAKL